MQESDPSSLNGLKNASLIRWHGYAALGSVLYLALLGILMSLKLHEPELLGSVEWLSWGRIRYAHTQGVFFGWLGNSFLAFLYYAVPRLTQRPVTSIKLGWLLFIVWNFLLVLPGWILVQNGISQPLEWAEFPLPIDLSATCGLLLANCQFVLPVIRARVRSLYVSAWYIAGGLTFTLLAYPVGNLVPELLPGARGATFSGLWIHDAVGLFATPLALAVAYTVIPVVTQRPIFSHFLSMIGFWLLFLLYPLNGTHHFVFSAIPMEAQIGAIAASIYLGADVVLVVTNLLLSLLGRAETSHRDAPLRFVRFAVVAYLIVSLQGAAQAIMPLNRFIHFSDWVIGHSHLAMIGFASFLAIGGLLHAWRHTPGCRYSSTWAHISFWLLAIGLTLMFFDLTIAGLIQASYWHGESNWIDSIEVSQPYWLVRTISGIILCVGFLCLIPALWSGARVMLPETAAVPNEDHEVAKIPGWLGWFQGAYGIVTCAGVGLFLFSFVVLGIWPNEVLKRQVAEAKPDELQERSDSQERGRRIYAAEGCLNCHSQLVRFTADDVRRFGAPTQAWEGEQDRPQLWGTRRIGPDLARLSGRHTRDWHQAHLWNPRHVVPLSNMPGYPWLFDGAADRPKAEAIDLLNYFDSLGWDARLAGVDTPQPLPASERDRLQESGMFCDCAIPRTRGSAPVWSIPSDPGERERFTRRGMAVYSRHCAGCHGMDGTGTGPAALVLVPKPRNLVRSRLSTQAISDSLWYGRPGTSMPRWNNLSMIDLRSLVAYVQSMWQAEASPILTVAESRSAPALFQTNCAVCHGIQGNGLGIAAARLNPAPSNFHLVQPNQSYAESTIAHGIPGTSMPPWNGKISAENQALLARYLRGLYDSTEK